MNRTMLLVALAASALAGAARADDHGDRRATALLPKYQQECSDCHVAYPPGMLPAASWQRILAGMDRHYGTNAALDAATQRELSAWLQANAGTRRRAQEEPPQDRISRAAWFTREHREVGTDVWTRASVKSAANCGACHTRAAQGDYSERAVRIPR